MRARDSPQGGWVEAGVRLEAGRRRRRRCRAWKWRRSKQGARGHLGGKEYKMERKERQRKSMSSGMFIPMPSREGTRYPIRRN
jgi:hypothetical protein